MVSTQELEVVVSVGVDEAIGYQSHKSHGCKSET